MTTLTGLAGSGPLDAEAILTSFPTRSETLSFSTLGPDGTTLPDSSWLVVEGTGNCCENYLASTAGGRLLDMGGDWIRYSDDRGETWTQVATPSSLRVQPAGAGEGAVAAAPNGDIVAVTWFPYDGDRLLATRYDTAHDRWLWKDVTLHTPFYDRPWISVIPGPIAWYGQDAPYLVVLKGAWPWKLPLYVSANGLDYLPLESTVSPGLASHVTGWIEPQEDPTLDHTQPIVAAEGVPLPGRDAAIANEGLADPCGSRPLISSPTGDWRCFSFPDGQALSIDARIGSSGWIHDVDTFGRTIVYRLSRDGGRTWAESYFALPGDLRADSSVPYLGDYDFKVNDRLRIGVLGMKTRDAANNLQVLVFRFSTKGPAPTLLRTTMLGKGDFPFESSLNVESNPRMDFMTVTILPDGTVAASFADSDHLKPVIAIEQH